MHNGKLVLQGKADKRMGEKSAVWHCLCECGNETYVSASCLGETESCGNCNEVYNSVAYDYTYSCEPDFNSLVNGYVIKDKKIKMYIVDDNGYGVCFHLPKELYDKVSKHQWGWINSRNYIFSRSGNYRRVLLAWLKYWSQEDAPLRRTGNVPLQYTYMGTDMSSICLDKDASRLETDYLSMVASRLKISPEQYLCKLVKQDMLIHPEIVERVSGVTA